MTDSLSKAIVRLFDQERFYAELVLQMDRVISKRVHTAGVCVKDRIELHINPEFFDSIPEKEQVAVLKHECAHIFNDHIARMKIYAPDVYSPDKDVADAVINRARHYLLNIAADCAINDGIPDIPEFAVRPAKYNLESGHTAEWYADQLKNHPDLKNVNSFDDHSLWGESDEDKDALRQKVKDAVNKAASKTRAAGKMSADNELIVDKMNYRPRDWRGDLRRFVANTLETTLETSRKKRNRRYGITQPGYVKQEELHIGVAIDTSGSVSDEAIHQFMAEVGNIAKYAKVTVVEADSEVKNSYLYDKNKIYKVKGRGGTAYQPAFDYFENERDVDGVIYFGDMDCADVPAKPKYAVLWAIIGDQRPPVSWGRTTAVEIRQKGSIP